MLATWALFAEVQLVSLGKFGYALTEKRNAFLLRVGSE
jgi:hypothetical protein